MEIINDDEILKKIEKEKDRAYSVQAERNRYLGIYKERVILALTDSQVKEKIIYKEVIEACKKKIATKMVLSRAVELKYLKKYMNIASQYELTCKLVDGLSYVGDIALVIASDDALNKQINPFVIPRLQLIKSKGLPDIYYDSLGKKISKKYLKIIKEKLPELADEYEELTFFDKLCGIKCPIEEKLGG
ncbi:DUF1694 domain-containing protein [Caviibacter abscessus]|uniref:DUF1694 domain-containing protein n=1 Tax=Caviibacter abscessus TaxID=1766719 RepID=UPI000838A4C1|nr:DUF1694 domain-containing protein [Caviibacter abscessus]